MQDNNSKGMSIGPGAFEDVGIAPTPLLDGATEYEVVTVHNPLSVDFIGLVGSSRPVNMPFQLRHDGVTDVISTSEDDVRRNYGLNLKNKDHPSKLPIQNKVRIPAGQTIMIMGHEAQVVVRQLVNEIMARQGKKNLLADPFQRHIVEQLVVKDRRMTTDAIATVHDQLRSNVDKMNQLNELGASDEPEFPGIEQDIAADAATAGHTTAPAANPQPSKAKNRPKTAA